MTDPLIPQQGYDADALAAAFDAMAAKIRLNRADNFGGAFVLVPPIGVGQPVDGMLINSANASMMFWLQLKMIVDDTIKQLTDQQRMAAR